MTPSGLFDKANGRAQRRFRDTLRAYFAQGTWDTREMRLYTEAERLTDDLEREMRWEESKAEWDLLQSQDHDYHVISGTSVMDCDDCLTGADEGYPFTHWTEAELRSEYGDR